MPASRRPLLAFGLLLAATLFTATLFADVASAQQPTSGAPVDTSLYSALEYRMIGPFRGGRSTAAIGFPASPYTFLMGTTGGGMWSTDDAGQNWRNISDGFFGGSVGAVAAALSDPAVIYVGLGSADIRGNTSMGRGLWKSLDGGKTWQTSGLEKAAQIGRIVVHPDDANLVYVAALGHPFGKNPERGVFRSKDGGATWEHVLALDDSTGVVSLSINPNNAREMYAGAWRGERKPWTMLSGGPNGGVYKTTDGGDTWNKLGGGLPEGIVGKVGVSVSPANPDRVWAIIEAEPEGGVYRSDDGGASWTRTNKENKLRQRAWYYTHVRADPQDANTVYALNTGLYRSVDGGTTFDNIEVPHGDVHDLWINPDNTDIMAVANDGGTQVTFNGGKSWSTYYNQPTAELYGVAVDNQFPYRVYGAQQDNTTISLPAWTSSNTLYPKNTWENPGGCETGPIALHPDHPEITYGGCYGGAINRVDHERGEYRNVILYPQLQLGEAAKNLEHRFQWVSPILVSRHNPDVVYHASQFVNRTSDGGLTWETISPDLTTDTPAHQDYSGGPLNHDITGVEIYNTIFSLAESPESPDVLWAGSDDGRLHITQDGGESWTDVTPSGMPKWGTVDSIDPSPHQPGRAVVAVQRYRMDDFKPYIFLTNDYGATWTKITTGLPNDHPVRVAREDPEQEGLFYAGTEFGLFVSFDGGAQWQPLQRNLPVTPVTDLRIAHDDLVLSTQGRSFWVLDDITPLRQVTGVDTASTFLFTPRDAYRANMRGSDEEFTPDPMPGNALVRFYVPDTSEADVTLDIVDDSGRVARTFTTDTTLYDTPGVDSLKLKPGMNSVAWDAMYPGPDVIEDAVLWGYTGGVKAVPGTYTARLAVGGDTLRASFALRLDPRLENVNEEELSEQFNLALQVRDTLNQVLDAIRAIQQSKEEVEWIATLAEREGADEALSTESDSLIAVLSRAEQGLMQTKNESNQDPIRFAPRLDNQYVELYNNVTGIDGYIAGGPEGKPTAGAYERFEELNQQWSTLRGQLREVMEARVAAFKEEAYNALQASSSAPAASSGSQ